MIITRRVVHLIVAWHLSRESYNQKLCLGKQVVYPLGNYLRGIQPANNWKGDSSVVRVNLK